MKAAESNDKYVQIARKICNSHPVALFSGGGTIPCDNCQKITAALREAFAEGLASQSKLEL